MIFKNLSIVFLAATNYATIVSAQGNTTASTVRTVKPWDDIAAAIESDAVDAKTTFTISASQFSFGQDAIASLPTEVGVEALNAVEETAFTFEVNVATPAVTADTLIVDEDGNLVRMGELSYSLLVPSAADHEAGTMALISVDHKTGEANGIVQKKGSGSPAMHIRQKKGQSIVAEEEAEFVPPKWGCAATEEHEEEPLRHRHLEEDSHHHDDHHHHDHSHHHHDHNHDHGLDGNDLPGSFEHLRKSLRGADVSKIGKRRKLEDSGLPYSFQIDMYIEFDKELVANNGGNIDDTYNYINSLVTMANQIYEQEVDTHLHVFQMELTDKYKDMKSAVQGLDIMRKRWAGNKWSNDEVDLHHLLSGKKLGGGIAWVGVVCNKDYGFGVSTSISGSYTSMDAGVTWDAMVFVHEVGHNLNSGHTFSGYNPPVDHCMRNENEKCPSGGIEDSSATLMSYCHMCGGFKKVEYTFGGEYDGSGNKAHVSNWKKSDKLGSTDHSVDPQRVPHKMYQHVASRGTCVDLPAPTGPTQQPTPTPTKAPSPPTYPPTYFPTYSPTLTPSSPPTTSPTPLPTFEPDLAMYNYGGNLGAPKCYRLTSNCQSGNLLIGRGNIAGGEEPNRPNTMDDCVDGNGGTYKSDESIESIGLKTLSGNQFQAGEEVEISVQVYSWMAGSTDFLDLWYAEDAEDPKWQYIGTQQPFDGGLSTITATYTLPNSKKAQAVRAVFRSSLSAGYSFLSFPAISACPGGTWTDVDDISFVTVESEEPAGGETVAPSVGPTPTPVVETETWYVDYNARTCKQGIAEWWGEDVFEDKDECCLIKFFWDQIGCLYRTV